MGRPMRFLRHAIDSLLERRLADAGGLAVARDELWPILREHGTSPFAYTALSDPAVKGFGDRRGLILYGQKMGETFVLGEPMADAADREALVDLFLARMGRCSFVCVGEETARLLAARGYRLNRFGHDNVIDLPGHSFAGGDGKRLRYSTSWLGSNGMRVEERATGDFPADAMRAMSDDWRRSRVRARRELAFLNRRFEFRDEPEVRRFFAVDGEGRPQGVISFDPVFEHGRVAGYLASGKRRFAEGSTYLDLAIMRHAIDRFREEGREKLWLGLSPLAPVEGPAFRDDPLVRRLLDRAYRSGFVNRTYFNLQGIAEYKNRFRGRKVPVYIAFPGGFNLVRLVALLRLVRLI